MVASLCRYQPHHGSLYQIQQFKRQNLFAKGTNVRSDSSAFAALVRNFVLRTRSATLEKSPPHLEDRRCSMRSTPLMIGTWAPSMCRRACGCAVDLSHGSPAKPSRIPVTERMRASPPDARDPDHGLGGCDRWEMRRVTV